MNIEGSAKNFEKAVNYSIELYEILKKMGVRDHSGEWLRFLHEKSTMDDEQERARALMDKIVHVIINQNHQVSQRIICDRVIYNLLQLAIWYPKEYLDFPVAARNEMLILFDYYALRTVDVPLVYLVAENPPVKFGLVMINNVTKEDRDDKWWNKVLAIGGRNESVKSYARVSCSGDLQISLESAKDIVNDMMVFLRAVGFPINTEVKNQFGLLNEYSSLSIPYRIGAPVENHKLEHQVRLSTAVSALQTYEIQKDIFNQVSKESLVKLQKLIEENYIKSSTDLKRKFLLGLRWLGEATKPDAVNSRFVKLFFSLEGFIGGDVGDSRDSKIILAKRCAIVSGKTLVEQKRIFNAILRYYKRRSEIVHGSEDGVVDKDFADLGKYVRKVAWSLLEKTDDFEDINELHDWALRNPSWSLL